MTWKYNVFWHVDMTSECQKSYFWGSQLKTFPRGGCPPTADHHWQSVSRALLLNHVSAQVIPRQYLDCALPLGRFGGICGVRSVENAECGKSRVSKMQSVENVQSRNLMLSVESAECISTSSFSTLFIFTSSFSSLLIFPTQHFPLPHFPHSLFSLPHFPHSSFSTLPVFNTSHFPHSTFFTPHIFHAPHFPHST